MARIDQPSNQDHHLVKIKTQEIVNKLGNIYGFSENSIGFEFLVLSKIFKRQEDEIIEDITDSVFLNKLCNQDSGPDRGIDALIIDNEKNIVHLFNFKYTGVNFDRVKDKNFSGNEVNEITVFLKNLYEKEESSFSGNSANNRLEEKVKEIWKKQEEGTIFTIEVHFVSNLFKGLAEQEEKRLISELKNYRGDISFNYILTRDIVDILISRSEKIDCKFKALSKNFFDKTEGGNRALILEISALDLLKITTNNSSLRNKIDFEDEEITNADIEENIFGDNVRVYLKQRTNINRNIKETVLNDKEKPNIFFYNNGITITCDHIKYQGQRNQTITLENFQIVNGGQTVHALRAAFQENNDNFEEITILCKIYETDNPSFKSKIAEYTNSQNPVKDRDIRSIDLVQIKLEEEFRELGYFYERKKSQHENQDRDKKIDSEKLGQSLLAFSIEMPAEAKDKKRIIFSDKYDEIFNDNLLAKDALIIFNLYKEIEKRKLKNKQKKPYLMYATYYIMFFIKRLHQIKKKKPSNLIDLYDEAVEKIEIIIKKEKEKLGEDYLDSVLFKTSRPKDYLTELNI
jgi:hypothetical protein